MLAADMRETDGRTVAWQAPSPCSVPKAAVEEAHAPEVLPCPLRTLCTMRRCASLMTTLLGAMRMLDSRRALSRICRASAAAADLAVPSALLAAWARSSK